jgi:hypothetical protein
MISLYSVALFLHILGAFGLVATFTVQALGLISLRRAVTREDALAGLRVIQFNRFIAPGAMALILVPGLYMMATTWGFRGWIIAGLGGLLLIGLIGGFGTGMRMARLGPALGRSTPGALGAELRRAVQDRTLVIALAAQVGIVIGVLFVMSVKPPGVVSAIVIVIAAGLGAAATQLSRGGRTNEVRPEAG